ncbi:tail fiber/spike domain-containing protein [Enterobacter pasteurii]|uniref:tail fiber/spike domain-containing protein n=1 Tax=Enterobacter pasteurii TaxID=3029761 RepID=UPI0039895D70
MATQPTNLPVPSESPRDLKFNAGKIDEYVTSMGWTYTDRFGQKHYTIEGNNYLAQQAMAAFGYVILTGKTFTTGATINQPNEVLLNTADGEYYKWTGSFASGPKVVPANSTPASTGGIGPGAWIGVGDASLRAALASSTGGNLIGLKKAGLPNNLATTVGAYYQTTSINAVTDYGMKPDFDPTTGVANGTNNKTAFRRMINDLKLTGLQRTVVLPPGNYYFDVTGDYEANNVNLLISNLKNVTFMCYGAVFYQGNTGRFLSLQSNQDINLFGLKIVGYAGGALSFSRSQDCCLNITYSNRRVMIRNCYLTNSLGDCIYIGGSLVSGGETGYGQMDVSIKDSVLVERYGNGIRSYEASNNGTRSRLAVAVVDVNGLVISGNIIYGRIDLEPNLSGQKMQYIDIKMNHFRSGSVGAAPTLFEEEPLYVASGHTLVQGVLCQGPATTANINNVFIENNSFEYGCIRIAWVPSSVRNNSFLRGLIIIGFTSGANYSEKMEILDNIAKAPFNGQDDNELTLEASTPTTVPQTFVWQQGRVAVCRILRNSLGSAYGYLLYADPSNSLITDGGRSYIEGNVIDNASGAIYSKAFALSTLTNGNINMSAMDAGVSVSTLSQTTDVSVPVTIPVTGSGSIIPWATYRGSNWLLTVTAAVSVSGISAAPALGTRVQLRGSDANATNTITLTHSSAFYLKGQVNAVLNDNRKCVEFEYIAANVWSEISRNF